MQYRMVAYCANIGSTLMTSHGMLVVHVETSSTLMTSQEMLVFRRDQSNAEGIPEGWTSFLSSRLVSVT